MNKTIKANKIIGILGIGLVMTVIISITLGRYPISLKEIVMAFTGQLKTTSPTAYAMLLNVRAPRIIMALLIGAALSTAGGVYQGVFQNPMAAPDILGASSGSAFGAALGILLELNSWQIITLSFLMGLISIGLVFWSANVASGKKIVSLILSGMVISALFSAMTSFIKLIADPADQLPSITYWLMGSISGADIKEIYFALIPMSIGFLIIFLLRWQINLLSLGTAEAKSMGINVGKVRLLLVVASTLLTAASVSVSGMIGWIGLVIPHMARKLVGDNYKHLIPACFLSGGIMLICIDNIARCTLTSEIPIGILTAFIGTPFFLYIMSRKGVS